MPAPCPKCQAPLLVPPGWDGQPLRCGRCGATVRGKPKATAPAPAPPPGDAFAWDAPGIVRPPAPRRRSGGLLWVLFGLLLIGGLAGGAVALKLLPLPAAPGEPEPPPAVVAPPTPAAKPVAYPRRLLVVSASKYLYCNRLAAGVGRGGDLPTELGKRLAFDWRVPQDPGDNQLVVLSDTAADPRPVLKPLLEQAVADFCRTCRPQDRVLLYFGGHAHEAGGKAFLVPAEGDPAEPDGLVPLDWLWARLKECPAAQKAVVFDVCRLNEDGDRVRPGGEPMTLALEKLLLDAPPGVQVVLTCSAGQQAHEFRRTPSDPTAADVSGSLFLSALRHVAARGKLLATPRSGEARSAGTPDDPLPVADWVQAAAARMAAVCEATGAGKQTPKVGGTPPGGLPPADPFAPPAEVVKLAAPPPGLPPAELAKLTAAVALPPIRERPVAGDDDTLPPFPADTLAAYTPPPPPDTPLRAAAAEALAEVRREWTATSAADDRGGLRTEFAGATDDALKKAVAKDQELPAKLGLLLGDRDRQLDDLAKELDAEKSPYWRATFRYAQAQLKARLAFMNEYNLLLGNVRTDRLPARDPAKGETGLQLVSVSKLRSGKEGQEQAAAARELFAGVARDHPGTPWAVFSKRAAAEALGLEWRPFAPGGKPKAD